MSFHPQTPQSPSQFSSGTSEPQNGLANSSVIATSTSTSTATTLPTPAHSVNGSASHPDVAMMGDSPHKRKRSVDDTGHREHKKVHLEESKLGIEDLHLDVGKKYLLCQARKTPSAALFPLLPFPSSLAARILSVCLSSRGELRDYHRGFCVLTWSFFSPS